MNIRSYAPGTAYAPVNDSASYLFPGQTNHTELLPFGAKGTVTESDCLVYIRGEVLAMAFHDAPVNDSASCLFPGQTSHTELLTLDAKGTVT